MITRLLQHFILL